MSFVQLPPDCGVREDELSGVKPADCRSYLVAYDLAGHEHCWQVRTSTAGEALAHVRRCTASACPAPSGFRVVGVWDY